jgi:hypothetical protein
MIYARLILLAGGREAFDGATIGIDQQRAERKAGVKKMINLIELIKLWVKLVKWGKKISSVGAPQVMISGNSLLKQKNRLIRTFGRGVRI